MRRHVLTSVSKNCQPDGDTLGHSQPNAVFWAMVTRDRTSHVSKLVAQLHSAPTAACQAERQAVLPCGAAMVELRQHQCHDKHLQDWIWHRPPDAAKLSQHYETARNSLCDVRPHHQIGIWVDSQVANNKHWNDCVRADYQWTLWNLVLMQSRWAPDDLHFSSV